MHKNLSPFPVLTTERLILRQLSENDVQEIFSLRSDEAINKYLGRKPCGSSEDALKFISSIRDNEFLYWAITKTDNDKLIGTICLFDFSEEHNKCEIGYELLTAFQGQGIMQEAVQSVIIFAADTLGVTSIDAFTHKDNLSSTKILQKFNFERVEIIDESDPDMVLMRKEVLSGSR